MQQDRVFKDELVRVPRADYRILLPVANPATSGLLLELAIALAKRKKGDVTLLHVVSEAKTAEDAQRSAQGRRILMEEIISSRRERTVPVHTMTRLADRPAQGILDTAREEKCNLILMGWEGHMRRRPYGASLGQVLDAVIIAAPCAVAVVKTKGLEHPHNLLVPTAGGPNAILALDMAIAIGRYYRASITLLHVAQKGKEEVGKRHLAGTLAGIKTGQQVRQELVVADDPAKAILKAARDYDLILLGATHETLLRQVIFGSVPEYVAKHCPKPIILVKDYTGPLVSWMRRAQIHWQTWWANLRLPSIGRG